MLVVVHDVTVPAMLQVPMPATASSAHFPAVVEVAPSHFPLQHCEAVVHASFSCRQYDVCRLHLPPTHPFEQHWLSPVQVLPDAKHKPPLLDWQTLPTQLPLQHWLPLRQLPPRFVHDGVPPSD